MCDNVNEVPTKWISMNAASQVIITQSNISNAYHNKHIFCGKYNAGIFMLM